MIRTLFLLNTIIYGTPIHISFIFRTSTLYNTMNWTGGALRNSTRGSQWNANAARHKKNSAKARRRYKTNDTSSAKHWLATTACTPSPGQKLANTKGSVVHDSTAPSTSSRRHLPPPIPTLRSNDQHTQLETMRNHGPHPSRLKETAETSSNDDVNVERKRLELLGQIDWVGIGPQKALLQGLAPPAGLESRLVKRQGTPLIMKNSASASRRYRQSDFNFRHYSRPESSMRLRIGDRDMKWSRENNSIRSPTVAASPSSARKDRSPQLASSSTYVSPLAPSTPSEKSATAQKSLLNGVVRKRQRLSTIQPDHDGTYQSLGTHNHQERTLADGFVIRSPTSVLHHPQPSRHSQPSVINLKSPASNQSQSMIAQPESIESTPRCSADELRCREFLQLGDTHVLQNPANDPLTRTAQSQAMRPFGNFPYHHAPVDAGPRGTPDQGAFTRQMVTSAQASKTSHPFVDNYSLSPLKETTEEPEKWWNEIICDNVADIRNNALETARNRHVQELCHSAFSPFSRVAHPPLTVQGNTFIPVSENAAAEFLSTAVGDDWNWTDLAHEQATQQQASNPRQSSSLKFSQPPLFVGRFASMDQSVKPSASKPPAKRKRGRPRRERSPHRPDIRAWPTLDGDPIDDMASSTSQETMARVQCL